MALADNLRSLWSTLKRRKVYSAIDIDAGNLKRCLTRWDLTALGVGATLGVGMYVLTGHVARELAGPSLVLSFLIAAIASLFAALCYAEFGARVPKAGSAYVYSYVCVGEFVAFIIGWILIFEYLIGSASVARGLSLYVDSIFNGTMQQAFQDVAPIDMVWMSSYFDFFAFLVILVLGLGLAFGLRLSSTINNGLAVVNLCIVLFVITAGSVAATAANWNIPAADLPPNSNAGTGGFFPFGVAGTIQGAAVCFYGFVGFDGIATTGEEVKEPRKSIPFAIMLTLAIVFVAYFGVSTVITMMVPYYLQSLETPLPWAFSHVGWEWARWVVSVGAIFGLCASLFGAMFPLPRIVYAMARDGLLFRFMGHVTSGYKSPVVATVLSALLISVLAAIFELRALVSLMSLGTLLAYTIVAACVLLLRYSTKIEVVDAGVEARMTQHLQYSLSERSRPRAVLLQLAGVGHRKPSTLTANIVLVCILLYSFVCACMGVVQLYVAEVLVPLCVLAAVALLLILIIALQPRNKTRLSFQVPLVPLVPCLSMFVNIYLMTMLPGNTWVYFLIWIAIGIPVYFVCLCVYDRRPKIQSNGHLHGNLNRGFDGHTSKSNKSAVTIVVQSPTPPSTERRTEDNRGETYTNQSVNVVDNQNKITKNTEVAENQFSSPRMLKYLTHQNEDYDTMLQNIEEGDTGNKLDHETQIIELLDQVLEAEEDSYPENAITVTESSEVSSAPATPEPHARAPTENSDAESLASVGGLASPTYDVVALIHREDLPKVKEEATDELINQVEDDEQMNEQILKEIIKNNDTQEEESNDQIINEVIHGEATVLDAAEDSQERGEEETKIDSAVPITDETGLSDDANNVSKEVEAKPFIPPPPPMNENLFNTPTFKRAHTIVVIPRKSKEETEEERRTHERTFSGSSFDDSAMVFGSDKQANFMSKLNDMLQNQNVPARPSKGAKRSVSSSHISDINKMERNENETAASEWQRPTIMIDLRNELMARHSKTNADLRPRDVKLDEPDTSRPDADAEAGLNGNDESDEEAPDTTMSREDLKSKLENIFAVGGARMLKPRLVPSNPPTPEPSLQGSTTEELFSSPELAELKDKTEKSDTLKLQRAKFGAVLNSFRISMAKDAENV